MNNRGFTLIELLLAIAILAILAVISFVSINQIMEESDINNCESLVSNIKSAAKEYVSDNRYNFDEGLKPYEKIIDGKTYYEFDASILNLTGTITNPFDDSVEVTARALVLLKNDFTVDSVTVTNDVSEVNCNNKKW